MGLQIKSTRQFKLNAYFKLETYVCRVSKKTVKTLKIHKTRKIDRNKKRFAGLALEYHGNIFNIGGGGTPKKTRKVVLMYRSQIKNTQIRNRMPSHRLS